MFARTLAAFSLVFALLAGIAQAGDKEYKAKLVGVDQKAKVLTVTVDGASKKYDVNDETKFIGPKGGVSDKGIRDDRLVAGVELRLLVAGNNRTLREVHIPEKKSK